LRSRTSCADHGLRYPSLAGAIANGIGSVQSEKAKKQLPELKKLGVRLEDLDKKAGKVAGLPSQKKSSGRFGASSRPG
jgi:hypothetical protein